MSQQTITISQLCTGAGFQPLASGTLPNANGLCVQVGSGVFCTLVAPNTASSTTNNSTAGLSTTSILSGLPSNIRLDGVVLNGNNDGSGLGQSNQFLNSLLPGSILNDHVLVSKI